jgi:hypothetical protein
METFIDIIGEICWFLMFITPLIFIPLTWKFIDGSRMVKVAAGLLLSVVCSIILFCIGMAILLRNGLGPG